MPRNHKKFTAKNKGQELEPLSFEIWDEEFLAVPRLQGAIILDFIAASSSLEEDNSAVSRNILPFFKSALVPESYDRFSALTRSQDRVVEVDELMDILSWLISEYTARPTEESAK